MSRPRLHDHARAFLRGPGSLQVGDHPDQGVVFSGLSDDEIRLIRGLDGSRDVDDLRAAPGADRLDALLAALRSRCLLADAGLDPLVLAELGQHREELAYDAAGRAAAYGVDDGYRLVLERRRRTVIVSGTGVTACMLASLLRMGGVGGVLAGARAADAIDLELRSGVGHLPDLVVLVCDGALPPDWALPWWRRGVALIPVITRAERVVVGPLLTPGGPCAHCLDLARCDADPAWPAVLHQITTAARVRGEAGSDSALAAVTAGITALLIHDRLDVARKPDGCSVEANLPLPLLVYRRWFIHPDCRGHEPGATIEG